MKENEKAQAANDEVKKGYEDIKNEMINLMCKGIVWSEPVDYDPEPDHMKADELLCTLLKKLGYNEIVDIYQNVKRKL